MNENVSLFTFGESYRILEILYDDNVILMSLMACGQNNYIKLTRVEHNKFYRDLLRSGQDEDIRYVYDKVIELGNKMEDTEIVCQIGREEVGSFLEEGRIIKWIGHGAYWYIKQASAGEIYMKQEGREVWDNHAALSSVNDITNYGDFYIVSDLVDV